MSFLESLPLFGPERDAFLLQCIAAGRLGLPQWTPITMGRVQLEVSRDYLKIDGERCPMTPAVAQAAVDALDSLLPTPAIVDAIEQQPGAIVTWLPNQPPKGDRQLTAESFAQCERETMAILDGYLGSDKALLAGHRKDVVLTSAMSRGRVYIFGARWRHGGRIEVKAHGGHGDWYCDYSHGVRAVRRRCLLDGKEALLDDVLALGLCGGPVTRLRYPTAPEAPAATKRPSAPASVPRTLRRGMTGADVRELQELLTTTGQSTTADGAFGPRTEASVRAFQAAAHLEVDGAAGPRTMAALRTPAPAPPTVPSALSGTAIDELFGPLMWVPAPTATEPGAIRITNDWQKDNLREIVVPQLAGIEGAPKDGAIFLHRLIAEQTRALWAAWEAAGLLPLVRSWAGSWNPRLIRGGSTLSRHAYAIGFDINATWNPLGKVPAPRGTVGSVVELVPLAVEHGFTWGGVWSRPDGMHFEAVCAA